MAQRVVFFNGEFFIPSESIGDVGDSDYIVNKTILLQATKTLQLQQEFREYALGYIDSLRSDNRRIGNEHSDLLKRVFDFNNLPWWKRIFKKIKV